MVRMHNRHCGANSVVEGDNQLVGLPTLRDVLLPIDPNYGDYIHGIVHSRDFIEMEEGHALPPFSKPRPTGGCGTLAESRSSIKGFSLAW